MARASSQLHSKNVTIAVIGLYGSLGAHDNTLSNIAGGKEENIFPVRFPQDLLSRTFLDGLVYRYCQPPDTKPQVEVDQPELPVPPGQPPKRRRKRSNRKDGEEGEEEERGK